MESENKKQLDKMRAEYVLLINNARVRSSLDVDASEDEDDEDTNNTNNTNNTILCVVVVPKKNTNARLRRQKRSLSLR